MIFRRLALSYLGAVFILCWLSQDTEALSVAYNNSRAFCTNVFDVGMVCATGFHSTPFLVSLDGRPAYLGGYSDSFQIVNAAKERTGLEIMTTLDDDGLCEVNVKYPGENNSVGCKSCSVCGNATTLYSADCTNLLYGRIVDCESSSVIANDIYFPLTDQALVEYAAAPGGDSKGGGSDGGPSDGQDTKGSSGYNKMLVLATTLPGGSEGDATSPPGGRNSTTAPGGSKGEATLPPGGSEGEATLPPGGSEGEATLPPGGSDARATNDTDEGIVGDGGINATEEPRANRALYALTALVVLIITAIAYLLLVKQRRTTPPPNSTSEAGLLQPPSSHGTIDVPRDPTDESLRVELPNNKDQCRAADPPLAYAVAIDSKSSDFAV